MDPSEIKTCFAHFPMVHMFQSSSPLFKTHLCAVETVEDFVQDELLEIRWVGEAKMLHESAVNLIEFWPKTRGKYPQIC